MRHFRLIVAFGGVVALILLIAGAVNRGLVLDQFYQRVHGLKEPIADLHGTAILAELPLGFVENHGQWDERAKFRARKRGLTAWLEQQAITLQLTKQAASNSGRGVVTRLVFEGSSEAAVLTGEGQQPGRYNYFLGDNSAQWHTGIPAYAQVRYSDLYEGIDLRVREQAGHLAYDLLLAPGANLAQVVIRAEGVKRLELTQDGSLLLHTAHGPIEQKPPATWQEPAPGHKEPAKAQFSLLDETRYGFDVPDRNPRLALVIDLSFGLSALRLDVSGDRPFAFASDARGTVTVAGRTISETFPAAPGGLRSTRRSHSSDVFVARVDPIRNHLVYSTYLGGDGDELANSVAVDGSGSVGVGGWTRSVNFPMIPAASQPDHHERSYLFVAWLNEEGNRLIYSRPLNRSDGDRTSAYAADIRARARTGAAQSARGVGVVQDVAAQADTRPLAISSYGSPSPASCSPIRLEATGSPEAGDGDVQLSIVDIPSDAGVLVVVAGASAKKHYLRSTVLVDRSDILITIPALPERVSGTAVLPLSFLHDVIRPGRTAYIQAFTAGCSFMVPFRASNALEVSVKP